MKTAPSGAVFSFRETRSAYNATDAFSGAQIETKIAEILACFGFSAKQLALIFLADAVAGLAGTGVSYARAYGVEHVSCGLSIKGEHDFSVFGCRRDRVAQTAAVDPVALSILVRPVGDRSGPDAAAKEENSNKVRAKNLLMN